MYCLRTEFWPFLVFIGFSGQIQVAYSVLSNGKASPYQFGLATISGFWEHSNITGSWTNQNQLVNIHLIEGSQSIRICFTDILQ